MKKIVTLFGLAFFALGVASTGSAATFDFIKYADKTADGLDNANNERGFKKYVVTEDNIQLTARGYKLSDSVQKWDRKKVYLDHGHAGLGVCSVGLTDDKQCSTPSDDNVTTREMLWFSFDQTVSFDEISFRDGSHGTAFDGNFLMILFSGGHWGKWKSYSLAHLFTLNLIGEGIAFYNPNKSASNSKQFYISSMNVSAVPIPAAIWLFGSALLGFTAVRRNAKSATKMTV